MDRMDSCTGYLACRERQHGLRKPGPAAAGLYPRLALEELLVGHRGCVNHVQFNESGKSTPYISCSCTVHSLVRQQQQCCPLLSELVLQRLKKACWEGRSLANASRQLASTTTEPAFAAECAGSGTHLACLLCMPACYAASSCAWA